MWCNYPDDIREYDNDPRSPFYDNETEMLECIKCHGLFYADELHYQADHCRDCLQDLAVDAEKLQVMKIKCCICGVNSEETYDDIIYIDDCYMCESCI